MSEKSEERLNMEKEAADLGIKGNIAGFKDETLTAKIAEAKDPELAAKSKAERNADSKPKVNADEVCVGVNACKGPFGIAGKIFLPGKDVILTKTDMANRNIDAKVKNAKKIGMIK